MSHDSLPLSQPANVNVEMCNSTNAVLERCSGSAEISRKDQLSLAISCLSCIKYMINEKEFRMLHYLIELAEMEAKSAEYLDH